MHRGGGVPAGGGNGGGTGGGRALDLEHPPMPGAAGFPWGAMLAGHHHHAAAAAAGMMQPPLSAGGEYAPAAAHHGGSHPAMPMDLHVPQGFPYYRYRDDALCWTDRKPSMDDVGNATSVNAR